LLILTNDGTQGNLVLKSLKVNTSKIAFWMNGVNKNIYNSNFNKKIIKRELGILEKEKILLTVSRLENWKKVDRIIKAIPCVIKEYQNFKLLVIGKGTERKKLENLVTKLQVTKYIKFLGALQYQKLKKYYNLADVFISLYDISNVGNPLLEAMSCGKCIITLDVGGTNKFIFNNQNGILLKTNDLNKLPKIIIMLLKDNNLRKSLGKAAKNFADKNFWTWKERIDTELSEVNKLIKND
jgi:glycosyltransferase involved in cell wall biosynthesis